MGIGFGESFPWEALFQYNSAPNMTEYEQTMRFTMRFNQRLTNEWK